MIYKLQNGWTIPLGGDYLEYLQNIPEVSGGSIQPSIKVESLPKKFNGSQKAARTYAEGYQKGAKPVTNAIDSAGQKIFNTTKNVAMFVPGPTGAITWLGQMGADTANGEYSKVAKDLGAAVLIGAGLKGAQAGAKAVGRTLAGKGINIPWLDAYDYSALRNQYFTNTGNKAILKATPDVVQKNIEAGKLGWAPSSKQTLWHNSEQQLTRLKINFPAWDVTERDAPLGHIWLTGTETTEGFLGARPYHLKGNIQLSKPMIQIGEAIGNGKNNTRNQILNFVQKSSADGINFKGIADNTLKNQDVYALFKNMSVKLKNGNWVKQRFQYQSPTTTVWTETPKRAFDPTERFIAGQNLVESLQRGNVPTIDAHGISKGFELENLENILQHGIDLNRGFHTAPLFKTKGSEGIGSVFGTISGTAYNDGLFILTSKPKSLLSDGIDSVLINDADPGYARFLKQYLQEKYPNFKFMTYGEAPNYYGVKKFSIPTTEQTIAPAIEPTSQITNGSELPPVPEETNILF